MIAEDVELNSYNDLILLCPFGTVNFTGSATALYTPSVTKYRISVTGKNVYFEDGHGQLGLGWIFGVGKWGPSS